MTSFRVRIGNSGVDLDRREVIAGRKRTRLQPKAALVLEHLLRKRGQPVARGELLDCVWAIGEGSDEALTQAISQLRRALGENGRSASKIRTIPKRGYLLVDDIGESPPLPEFQAKRALLMAFGAGGLMLVLLLAGLYFNGSEVASCVVRRPGQASAIPVPCDRMRGAIGALNAKAQ